MSIIEEYPGTFDVIRKYVDRGLKPADIKRIVGRSVKGRVVDTIVDQVVSEKKRADDARRIAESLRTKQINEVLDRAIANAVLRYRIIPVRGCGPSVDSIIDAVAIKHGLTRNQILSDSKSKPIVLARHEGYFIAVCETRLSLPQIGKKFRRDHTSILHGVRMHALRNGLPLPRGMTFNPRIREVGAKCGQDVSSRFYGDFSGSDVADQATVTG